MLLIFHAFASFAMTGLILTIQFCHYPSFNFVKEKEFKDFHRFHVFSISLIVAPLMVFELFSGVFLWMEHFNTLHHLNLICLAGIWLTTIVFSIPKHGKLEKGRDENAIRSLVKTNIPRTIFWLIKSYILILILEQNLMME